MNTTNQFQFGMLATHPPRSHSKRTINAEPDPPNRGASPFFEPKRTHFGSDRKLRGTGSLAPFDDEPCHPRPLDSESHSRNPFTPFGSRRLKHENSWLERLSSQKPPWNLPDSERRLRAPDPGEPLLPARVADPRREKRPAHYFSDRDLARVAVEKRSGRFRLETLDDELLQRDRLRHVSMRMICKRGFEQFSGRPVEHRLTGLGSMEIIDEKFCQFSFKSRPSVSRSRVGDDARGGNFSPFPLSKINQGTAPRAEDEEFLNNIGTGAFKKVLTRDPMTKAGTGSDARMHRNSAMSSPFEYNGVFGPSANRPFIADLTRRPVLRLSTGDTGYARSNRFNSQRKIPMVRAARRHDTNSWRDITRPWRGEQARVWSNRMIPMAGEGREGSAHKGKASDNPHFRTSKRDLLEIETKYINQDGEDKSAIEEKPHEREDLSCDHSREPDLPLFQNLGKAPVQSPVEPTLPKIARLQPPLESAINHKTHSPPERCSVEAGRPEETVPKTPPQATHRTDQDNRTSLEKTPLDDVAADKAPCGPQSDGDSKGADEEAQLAQIKANLDECLQSFDKEREFPEFHNLLGLLSCLFVTGHVEERYLSLSPDERGILAAIVYRKFKKSLNPE